MISKQLMAASTRPMILAILARDEDYGYRIIQKVKSVSGGRLEWTDGMLYPVLQRMEMDGLIASRWRVAEGGRPRRYYRITEPGRKELESELAGWRSVWAALSKFSSPLPSAD
jgi:DNA-binding PadR family transcriptional regulator